MFAVWGALLGSLSAQDDAERLRRLEERVRKQPAEIDQLKSARSSEREWTATFDEGLRWRAKDEAFDIYLGGRFKEQFRYVARRPNSARTEPDTYCAREALLTADGTLWGEFGFLIGIRSGTSAFRPMRSWRTMAARSNSAMA